MSQQKLDQFVHAKVEKAIGDLSSGGALNPEQANEFFTTVQDQPTLLNRVRSVRMKADTIDLPKLTLGGRMFKVAGAQGLDAADEYAFTAANVQLTTKKVIATIPVSYNVLDLNVEGNRFLETLLREVAIKAAVEFEEFMLTADTAGGFANDDIRDMQDGIIKKAEAGHTYDAQSAAFDENLVTGAMLQLPSKYTARPNELIVVPSLRTELKYRNRLSQRNTQFGDQMFQGNAELKAQGAPIVGAPAMPEAKTLITLPKNMIWGMTNEITIEQDRRPKDQTVYIVVTARIGTQLQETDAIVTATNIAA